MYDVVTWLMKEPAGMKLNDEFSLILGLFFQFHISLWWTFLSKYNLLSMIYSMYNLNEGNAIYLNPK